MDITKDIILKYLSDNCIVISKDSTDEELYMFEFLTDNKLMTKQADHYTGINNEGKAYQVAANTYSEVPLTVNGWKEVIIDFLKDGEDFPNGGNGKLHTEAIIQLKQDRIIEKVSNTSDYRLTTKGRRYLNSGLSYDSFLNKTNSGVSNIHIGDVFDNNQKSSFSTRNSFDSNNIKITKEANPMNKLKIDPVYMICMIVFGLITVLIIIYEFVLKHVSWH